MVSLFTHLVCRGLAIPHFCSISAPKKAFDVESPRLQLQSQPQHYAARRNPSKLPLYLHCSIPPIWVIYCDDLFHTKVTVPIGLVQRSRTKRTFICLCTGHAKVDVNVEFENPPLWRGNSSKPNFHVCGFHVRFRGVYLVYLPETNTSHLEKNGWNNLVAFWVHAYVQNQNC